MMNKSIIFKLPVVITKQNRRFVAYTPALDLSTSGKSEKDVKKKFVEIANIFFEEIVEAGTVNDVLSELGWKKTQKRWSPPKVISSPFINLKVHSLV